MSPTVRTTAVSLASCAVTVVVMLLLDPRGAEPPAQTPGVASLPEDVPGGRAAAPGLEGRGEAEPGADLLAPTASERAFLREALRAERVRRREAVIAPSDTGIDILRRSFEHGADVRALMRSFDGFAAHVRAGAGPAGRFDSDGGKEPTVANVDTLAAGTAVIEFGPGVFELRWRGRNWLQPISHIEIRGAGMDETTVVVRQDITVGTQAEHFHVRDLTVRGNQILDVRGRAAAVFERVRFSAGDSRKPYETPVYNSGEAYLGFRDCEFLASGTGQAVATRGNTLALFERCLFYRLDACVTGWGGAASKGLAEFRDCQWEHAPIANSHFEHFRRPEYPLFVTGGSVRFGDAHLADDERRKAWGAGYTANVEGTTFGPVRPVCSLADLVAAIEAVDPAGSEVIGGARIRGASRDGWRQYYVDGYEKATGVKQTWVVTREGMGAPLAVSGPMKGGGRSLLDFAMLRTVRGLPELVGLSGQPADRSQDELYYRGIPGDRKRPGLHLGEDWPGLWLDAVTGEKVPFPK